MSKLTREEAIKVVTQLRNQRVSFPKIAEHLRQVGYISDKSKGPIGSLAVRNMFAKSGDKASTEVMDKVAPKLTLAPSRKRDVLSALEKILAIEELGVETKLKVIQDLMASKMQ